MEKLEKKFVEYLYADSSIGNEKEINHNDPTKIKLLEGTIAFRFFEREYILDNSGEYPGEIKNKSRWYYFGMEITRQEVVNKYKGRMDDIIYILFKMDFCNSKRVCITGDGQFVPMNDEDITIFDYILSKDSMRLQNSIQAQLETGEDNKKSKI